VQARIARLLPFAAVALAIVGAVLFTQLLPSRAPAASPVAHPAAAAAPAVPAAPAVSDDASLARLGIALLVLVGLGAGVVAMVRTSRSSASRRRGRARSVEVLDVLALGGKRSIAVARVYDRVLVLGIGDGPVSLLTEVRDDDGAEAETPAVAAPIPAPPAAAPALEPFRQLLSRMSATRRAPVAEPEPEPALPVEVPPAPRRRTIAFTGATAPRQRVKVEELL